ncbi:MAG: O-antigen ligase [Porticoccus sp.]
MLIETRFREKKWIMLVIWVMTIGLFLQLAGKILFTSGSANGVYVYLFFIIPSAVASVWLACKRTEFFSREVRLFLLSSAMFMGVCSISAAWGDGEYTILYLLKRSAIILFYLVGVICLISVSESKYIKTFLLIVCVVAAVGAVVSVGYQLFVLDKPFGWRTFRITSMGYKDWVYLGHPVIAGVYLGVFAVISMAVISQEKSTYRYVAIAALLAMLPYIFLTYSRTAWVSGAIAGLFLVFNTRSRVLIWTAIFLAVVFLMVAGLYFEGFAKEVTDRQFSGRAQGWAWAVKHLSENIFLGHGYDHTFWKGKFLVHAHNFYLQVSYEQGLAGLATLLAMLSIVCKSYWRYRADSLVSLGFSLVVYLLLAMLVDIDHVISRPGVYWTIFWFPLAFTLGAVNRVYLLEKTNRSFSS